MVFIGCSFENWTPIWEQNTENNNWHGKRYQNYSISLVRQAHPSWSLERITAQAKVEFEGIKTHMQLTRTYEATRRAEMQIL